MMGEVEPVVDVGDKLSAPATLPTGDDIAEATDSVPATGESTFPKVSPTPPPSPAAHAIQVPTGSLNRTIYSASWWRTTRVHAWKCAPGGASTTTNASATGRPCTTWRAGCCGEGPGQPVSGISTFPFARDAIRNVWGWWCQRWRGPQG